ncbi:VOC family protein [Streptomyces sp. GD-15H]|uniref:VOC family protein n=1 Tax=Streptomyces sp. GD-15H TaxID=3129112 RepID=UPI0032537C34
METRRVPQRGQKPRRRVGQVEYHVGSPPRPVQVSVSEDVLDLGATLLDEGDGQRSWRILADPAGHPFRLVRN